MKGSTHFIEVCKTEDDYLINLFPQEIGCLSDSFEVTKSYNFKTVAVWYIKPTDMPLQTRLDLRQFGMGYGQVDDGETYKIYRQRLQYQNITLDKIRIPQI